MTTILLLWCPVLSQTDATDFSVLQEFLKGLSNPQLLKWSGSDPCGGNWPHLQCQGSSVTAIAVAGLGLQGTLTSDLNKLSKLQYLGLQDNFLSGPLPSLSGLQSLQVAYLNNNNFNSLPADFFKGLTSLTAIYLDHSNLNGTKGWILPSDILASTKLSNLSLTNTSLTGSIPAFLGTIPSLKVLNLAYNKLGGGIPSSFSGSNLVQLQANNMMGPVLTGPIDVVGSMTSLTELWLQVNQISSTIPAGLSNALTLQNLRINDNQFTGPIPAGFANLPLTSFIFDNNELIGPIPAFQTGVSITSFGNNFCQPTAGLDCSPEVDALLAFIGALGYPLSIVSSWKGNDPCSSWIGVACNAAGHVSVINLANNQLLGTISPAVANLTSLIDLKLNNNNITGGIPAALVGLKSLRLLDLSNNQLSGNLPSFPPQVTVHLQGNPQLIQPSAPSSSPPKPRPVPSPVSSTPSPPLALPSPLPAIATPAVTPSPTSALIAPESASVMPPVSGLPLNSSEPPLNRPDGAAPAQAPSAAISNAKHSTSSSLTGILVGAMVATIAILAAVVLFVFLRKRKHHEYPRLLASHSMNHLQDTSSDPESVKRALARSISNGRSSETGSRASSGTSEVHVVEGGQLITCIQILRDATKNFSEQSILGRGGFGVVYKGELADGTSIAVKRMEAALVSRTGLSEFQAEIAVLTKVRHRHLVALLGYCIDGFEKLLVYEYMSNGNLSQHLFEYGTLGWSPLDWKKRVSIAFDVARGMEYLHLLAHKSFIHRDLKPSNILLDNNFRAKVSDFGLVKHASEGTYSVETRLAGTFGYLAPEYAVTGRVTTKADVYSYGVVLMELITGRRALDETQTEENVHLVTWFRRMKEEKESFCESIDPVIELTDDTFQSIWTVAELAGHCTAHGPYQRPDMGHVVNVLSPLVGQWKPTDMDGKESGGIDLNLTLPQALKKWQDLEDSANMVCLDESQESIPVTSTDLSESFASIDGR
ncbi:hypothetical protein O6H91_Y095300 [Diphasiastrum complanatum]|nr:hypothetical protein O6H91_Y222800 [Diphasiastrum complanatum]KAJ7300005.1 hypothetical protein O6H91_Y095300 [Diphasiastrum complanatum]